MKEHKHHLDQNKEYYQDVLNHLREKGVRITETRKAVIDFIIQSHDHPSADMIYQALLPAFPNMSLATVYNNLKVLIDEGFVSELKVRNDTTTYYDFMGHQHLNVICEKCGRIADMDLDLPDVQQEAADQTGYQITKSQMVVYGICPDCVARQQEAS
ncbi:peroxide-responsive transcriptional repressor PerR [Streptococcus sp. SG1]|jgi:ferric transport regulator protein|uniref:peroxide-responsive transcriptional repressor PerR n=1 Tax=Streptococcus TaxID=1301 RepID=UPI0009C345D8|nr:MULTISPECIES: peroxide-responsive transcriptional repressor PerR [Streptococcus]ARC46008.1 transcriptional repressor [Streptococcus gordonii]MCB6407304.1 peroxide-responsive transcriptional repressor PerR [Streptococcus gordonii]MCB6584953.1 peroxide-responsive transcriptional repressor PerR [Streptococcus gordonii]MCB7053928.1 peroxide-responsive transcriptional repressor PerR [Streptococcus gordonii]MCB7056015.1 peroxide-responsive transcriptional repressor PerR [Streptococcus gordonii]